MTTAPPSARTKREAERLIAASGIAYAILRPGFVVAPAAYGGSAHAARAGGASVGSAGRRSRATPFQPVAVEDIAATIAWLAARDIDEPRRDAVTLGPDAAAADHARRRDRSVPLRRSARPIGRASRCRPSCSISAPGSAISPTGSAGCRRCARTAIAELRRGVTGDPAPWMAATGIVPKTHRAGDRRPRRPPSRTNGSRGCS